MLEILTSLVMGGAKIMYVHIYLHVDNLPRPVNPALISFSAIDTGLHGTTENWVFVCFPITIRLFVADACPGNTFPIPAGEFVPVGASANVPTQIGSTSEAQRSIKYVFT
jgi:hypothetical protein